MQRTSAIMSTYLPTRKQKNAAQNGPQLLSHMAIPQLGLVDGSCVKTNSGQDVDLFIDYMPASEQDLNAMAMSDVKKVEYYDYPADPRFLGKAHVVNFVMQHYEYGGYVKAYANEFFISNSGQLNLFAKLQHRKMTYDIGVGAWYSANDRLCQKSVETYRLPQPDGSEAVFQRTSTPLDSKVRERSLWPTLKATYNNEKITMVNTLGANFFFNPARNSSGQVLFSPEISPATAYSDIQNSRNSSITYSGFWNFVLPRQNTINFNSYYSYAHTRSHTLYSETSGKEYENGAVDDSHNLTGTLRWVHDFNKAGKLTAIFNGYYHNNHTNYTGTAAVTDRLTMMRIGPGLMYNFSNKKINAVVDGGFNYDHSRFGDDSEHSLQPWVDASIQYSLNNKNSFSSDFHYFTGIPASSTLSNAVIQSNPLMSYTGNPELRPYKGYNARLSYTWMPDNRWNMSVFGNGTFYGNRYAYDYSPSVDGILRTISQQGGKYRVWLYGVSATARLLNNNLTINGQLSHRIVENGTPYNWTKQRLLWYVQAFYYAGNWNFGLQYQSPQAYCDGFMTGTWTIEKSAYSAIVGWGNSTWNLQARVTNPFRWNWTSATSEMKSRYYEIDKTYYNTSNHCFILVSATYTIGFGKKIQRGNEAGQQTGTASSILK